MKNDGFCQNTYEKGIKIKLKFMEEALKIASIHVHSTRISLLYSIYLAQSKLTDYFKVESHSSIKFQEKKNYNKLAEVND